MALINNNPPILTESDNADFHVRTQWELETLFRDAKNANELEFAWALIPELRGMKEAGWDTTQEVFRIIDDYSSMMYLLADIPIRARLALSLYAHLAEAGGLYEIPTNMLRIVQGLQYSTEPFHDLVKYSADGKTIAPNHSKVIGRLAAYAKSLGRYELCDVFRNAFCADIRNGYAHADYVVWKDGLRIIGRNGGPTIVISWEQFGLWLDRAIDFFTTMRQIIDIHIKAYATPKTIITQYPHERCKRAVTISYNTETGRYRIEASSPLPESTTEGT